MINEVKHIRDAGTHNSATCFATSTCLGSGRPRTLDITARSAGRSSGARSLKIVYINIKDGHFRAAKSASWYLPCLAGARLRRSQRAQPTWSLLRPCAFHSGRDKGDTGRGCTRRKATASPPQHRHTGRTGRSHVRLCPPLATELMSVFVNELPEGTITTGHSSPFAA